MSEIVICRNTTGQKVAEVDLAATTMTVTEIVDRARKQGADLVWAHGGDPEADGFVRKPGYAHLRAQHPKVGEPLPSVAADAYGPLLAKAYLGQWGHKWVDPRQSLPTDGSIVLCGTKTVCRSGSAGSGPKHGWSTNRGSLPADGDPGKP